MKSRIKKSFIADFALFSIILAVVVGGLGYAGYSLVTSRAPASEASAPRSKSVIVDAGHGGEDGGASSAAGLIEKDVNLEIATILCDMLRANDINVIMTREDDRLLYDRSVNYQGRKKKLDLAARLAVANSTPDAIFISIHMNSFTDSRYSGLQVWYSPNNQDSSPLAELIRSKNHELLQPQNSRTTKSATSAINLLHNASCPAVLVECGFLSNPDEAALFENDEYRQRVAFMLFCSIIEFLNTGNE